MLQIPRFYKEFTHPSPLQATYFKHIQEHFKNNFHQLIGIGYEGGGFDMDISGNS